MRTSSINAIFSTISVAILSLACHTSHAAYLDNGITTLDTTTGLHWLDLDQTNHLSYNEVQAELSPGGAFDQYRVASENEILNLFFNFNLESGLVNENHLRFIELFGVTQAGPGDHAMGYADAGDLTTAAVFGLNFLRIYGEPGYELHGGTHYSTGRHVHFSIGTFLITSRTLQPVPELDQGAAPLAIMLLLLTVAIAVEKRRRQYALRVHGGGVVIP